MKRLFTGYETENQSVLNFLSTSRPVVRQENSKQLAGHV